jgi:hypothetical protein
MPRAPEPEILFGIGGGTGFGRFAYGGQVTLLTRITTRETSKQAFLAGICQRLKVPFRMSAAAGPEPLRKTLQKGLAAGRVPLVWVNAGQLPWASPPAAYQAVAVLDIEDVGTTVFDGEERRLELATLLAAAGMAGGARYRSLVVEGPPRELNGALRAGLAAHQRQMREGLEFGPAGTRASFGLPGLARWAARLKEDGPVGGVLAVQIEQRGGGPGMREAQAVFLDHLGLSAASAATREAAQGWREVAEALRLGVAEPAHVDGIRDAEARALDNQ